ncbi:MAG: DUF2461 domain-containing protein [Anaerolineales bacterium]
MKSTFDFHQILNFLEDLIQHNSRDWFDQNRPAFEIARGTFEVFIDSLIDELRTSDDLQGLSSRECIFRIYRDVRFSKDKSPYNTNFSAVIAPGGKKSLLQGYYVSIEPHGRSMIAGGLHMPTPEQLSRFRQAVDQDASALKAITGNKVFIEQFGKIEGQRLKTAPKGYDRDHPEIELLQLKEVVAIHNFPDQQLVAGDFLNRAMIVCRAMKPFLDYLNKVLQ